MNTRTAAIAAAVLIVAAAVSAGYAPPSRGSDGRQAQAASVERDSLESIIRFEEDFQWGKSTRPECSGQRTSPSIWMAATFRREGT